MVMPDRKATCFQKDPVLRLRRGYSKTGFFTFFFVYIL